MSKIVKLPQRLADMIAAGEVVERPSSVVKELFENAADAGADSITVEIKNGGLTYISVSDNGFGIGADDAPNAFLRHATSKISTESDLESIVTLGFRGEALAAIASVSRVELVTRTPEAAEGTRICLEGGEVVAIDPAERAAGTTVTVRDLFFNTPARQKFVKTDRAEASSVLAAVQRLALSRPDIAVRYIRDGSEELRTPGDGRADSCVYAVLGRDFSSGMLPVENQTDDVRTTGFVSRVSALRGNRAQQFFFVNGRCVRSKTLQAALEQAYRNRMFTGRYPACVIYIDINAGRLDVNVHPAKTEIKFLFEKHVFDAVHYGALAALDGDETPAEIGGAPLTGRAAVTEPERPAPLPGQAFMPWSEGSGFSRRAETRYAPPGGERFSAAPDIRSPVVRSYEAGTPIRRDAELRGQEMLPETAEEPYRVVGEALGTYITVEAGGSLWLIDKHAAHERVHFDRLKSAGYDPMPQTLLESVIIAPGADGAELLLENAHLLDGLGFAVEDFGGGRLAVRQIPTDIDLSEAEGALTEIAEELRRGGDMSRRHDEILASVACKAAIKAGRESGAREIYELAGRVMSGEVRFCPHGRPVAVELTKAFIDRSFKRI